MTNGSIDNGTLRKLQLTQKEILDEIVRVCKNNGIGYFLAYGTLLGAVRHRGFIPWDDDLDICMMREDYEKFIRIASSELAESYYCVNPFNTENYGVLFAKVMKKGTVYVEENAPDCLKGGIFVDVFPLDVYGEKALNNPSVTHRYFELKRMLLSKCGYNVAKSLRAKLSMTLVRIRAMFLSKKTLLDKIALEQKKIEATGNDYAVAVCGSATGKTFNKKIRREWFDHVVELEFEGDRYSCPSNFDEVLRADYGDYMQLPPEDKRYGHHGITELSFGDGE